MHGFKETFPSSLKSPIFLSDEEGPVPRLLGPRTTSPSRQKTIKTKPRGLDEETKVLTTFPKSLTSEIQLDESVWAHLPDDLQTEILARVPPFLLFRLRPVCKRWNLILNDSGFISAHSRVPVHGPCLLTFWRNPSSQLSILSIPLRTWFKMPFGFLPEWVFWLVGSSGGLVCFTGFDGSTFKTLICNLLTQTWRILPRMHHNQQRQLILVKSNNGTGYKVIAASEICGDSKTVPIEVYDSRTDTWSLHDTMPAVSLCSSKMAFCDSRLYLETLNPIGLMVYQVDKGKWDYIPAKFPRSLLDGYLVSGAKGRLFLVGRVGIYSTLQSMRIWELDHGKRVWTEITRMPPRHFRSLLRLSAERFECFGQGNLICFTSWNQGKGLLYDVEKKTWSWIMGPAVQLCNSQVCFYEPRFDTVV
ncbi:F-box/kelch-repeat protein [Rhynchospora pubera]|uniref:F-box/kelch-repeat protein n=1 Tax=Rhynchospora pubera TaxID=906938 RepID=A0AAV8F3R9_9POAL|nr:F-box/kelch-repeat protein [Rhynchospora pubera]KAJ4778839.1 F-box/kelch-repeat protein [Rhynchospora pubera]KAJ4785716.1 F-box/kelch-repeat protein [Rhynchospora pubera]